jgi:hypothetical protein
MDQLIPTLGVFLGLFAPAFREEVFGTFQQMVVAWIVCLGRRSISRVWETTGKSRTQDHSAAFRLFSQAVWNWDEVCRILLVAILDQLVPGLRIWVVVDDTLCHKRGAKVAFGGIFVDAVLSTKRHKVFRFGNNWVMLGIVIELPFRKNRYFCLPIMWRIYEKRGTQTKQQHRTKSRLAADMIALLATWVVDRKITVVADSAYIGKHLLKDRPAQVEAVGPMCWKAALTRPLVGGEHGGCRKGKRLPTPAQMLKDDRRWPAETMTITFKNQVERTLEVKVVTEVCWYTVTGTKPVQLVLVRDPQGEWRDEALVCTDVTVAAAQVITGYCRRWSVEVAFCDAKQLMGFHDPQVWCTASVERAAPMAWFVGSLVTLWYAEYGHEGEQAHRHRPWYTSKEFPTFADMVASCRWQLWRHWFAEESGSQPDLEEKLVWFFEYVATAA